MANNGIDLGYDSFRSLVRRSVGAFIYTHITVLKFNDY